MIKGLVEKHHVYVLGFNEENYHKINKVTYVSLGSNQNKFKFIKTAIHFSILNKNALFFINTLKYLFQKEKKIIQQQNFETAIAQIKPDIIHLQWPSLLPWCETVLQNKEINVLLSQRGSQTNIRPFIDPTYFNYLRKCYPKTDGFHSVSKAISLKGDVIWNDKSKVDKVIYTGLQLEKFSFSLKNNNKGFIQLLSVGRVHWVKGYNDALKCCELLKKSRINFQYTIVGATGDEELLYLRNELDLEKEVVLKNRIPQEQVVELMKSSSVLLMPSVEEGMPNVIVEAMALGLPVISADCGGVTELIKNDIEGWVVPMRNPEALAEAIKSFIDMPLEKINKLQLAARKKVEEQHSEKQMVAGMEQLYYDAINNHSIS